MYTCSAIHRILPLCTAEVLMLYPWSFPSLPLQHSPYVCSAGSITEASQKQGLLKAMVHVLANFPTYHMYVQQAGAQNIQAPKKHTHDKRPDQVEPLLVLAIAHLITDYKLAPDRGRPHLSSLTVCSGVYIPHTEYEKAQSKSGYVYQSPIPDGRTRLGPGCGSANGIFKAPHVCKLPTGCHPSYMAVG